MKSTVFKSWCSTQNVGKRKGVRPCIVPASKSLPNDLLLTAQGSSIKVSLLKNGEHIRSLTGGHVDSRVTSMRHASGTNFIVSTGLNGSMVIWDLVEGKATAGFQVDEHLVGVEIGKFEKT